MLSEFRARHARNLAERRADTGEAEEVGATDAAAEDGPEPPATHPCGPCLCLGLPVQRVGEGPGLRPPGRASRQPEQALLRRLKAAAAEPAQICVRARRAAADSDARRARRVQVLGQQDQAGEETAPLELRDPCEPKPRAWRLWSSASAHSEGVGAGRR